jgi:hypothetical protein
VIAYITWENLRRRLLACFILVYTCFNVCPEWLSIAIKILCDYHCRSRCFKLFYMFTHIGKYYVVTSSIKQMNFWSRIYIQIHVFRLCLVTCF